MTPEEFEDALEDQLITQKVTFHVDGYYICHITTTTAKFSAVLEKATNDLVEALGELNEVQLDRCTINPINVKIIK